MLLKAVSRCTAVIARFVRIEWATRKPKKRKRIVEWRLVATRSSPLEMPHLNSNIWRPGGVWVWRYLSSFCVCVSSEGIGADLESGKSLATA